MNVLLDTVAKRRAAAVAAAVVCWFVFQAVLARPAPLGIVVLGVALGSLNALLAIGLVLIYRTNRIINFAHGEMGGVAAVLAVQLSAAGWNYFLAIGCGLLAAMAAGGIIEVAFVRRFQHAPRLLLTVVTIALAQVLGFAALIIPTLFGDLVVPQSFTTPLSGWRFDIHPVVFAVVACAALGFLLRRTRVGVGLRAAAENADRAALCGIPYRALSTLIWVVAALLSASAAILQAPVVGLSIGVLIGPGLLLRGLAAAVIGRMESLPVTVAAAIALGVFEQAVFWSYGRSTVVDALLLVVIIVSLLAQRRRFSRVDAADASTWQAVGEVRPIPRELAGLAEVRRGRLAIAAAIGLVVLAGPLALDVSRTNLASVIVIWAIVGVALVVLTGWAGQISLGHFALVGLGAAVAGTLSAEAGADFLVSMAGGAGAGLVAALVLGLPALRLRGFFLAVTTLAFAVTTSSYLLRLDWLAPDGLVDRPNLLGRLDLRSDLAYYYFCLALLALVVVAVRRLRTSRMGRIIVAVRDNEKAAQSYGASAMLAKLSAFAVSGTIAGLAGGLLVHHQYRLQVVQYDPAQSLQAFAMAVIGGLGSIPGAILGAAFVKGSQNLLNGPWALLGTGAGVLVVLLLLPRGLGSLVFAARDGLLRLLAARRGIVVASLLADRRTDRPDEASSHAAALEGSGAADLDAEPVPV